MRITEEFKQLIADFLTDPARNRSWIRDDVVSLYLRKSSKAFDGEPLQLQQAFAGVQVTGHLRYNCLDISSIDVRLACQGQGIFNSVVEYLYEVSPYQYAVLECVENPILTAWAERNSWKQYNHNCYWKDWSL